MIEANSEALFRTIFESSPECVKLLDQDGAILDMNPAGLEMLDSSREEIVGQSVHKLIPEKYQDAYYQLIQDALRGGQRTLEFEIGDEQGACRWYEARIAPLIGDDGATNLVVGITRDIHEKKIALLESERLAEENRWLARQLMEAQEVERKQIARELHDNLGHQLLAIRMDAEFIQHQENPDHSTIKSTVERILDLTERMSREVRDLSEHLHPLTLKYMELSDSLQEVVREWGISHRSLVISYRADDGDQAPLSDKGALALYRVLQEGLVNISRHSGATAAQITLEHLTPGEWNDCIAVVDSKRRSEASAVTPALSGAIRLIIQDNGQGMNLDGIKPGRGLLGMRERIGALGGVLMITSTPTATGTESQRNAARSTGSGATISAILPLDAAT